MVLPASSRLDRLSERPIDGRLRVRRQTSDTFDIGNPAVVSWKQAEIDAAAHSQAWVDLDNIDSENSAGFAGALHQHRRAVRGAVAPRVPRRVAPGLYGQAQ